MTQMFKTGIRDGRIGEVKIFECMQRAETFKSGIRDQ